MHNPHAREDAPASNPNLAAQDRYRQGLIRGLSFGLIPLAVSVLLYATSLYGQSSDKALFIDQNGNVGIGRTDPTSALHVGVGKSVRFELDATHKLSLGGNGTFEVDAPNRVGGRFIVTDNGNVGIGTPNPERRVEIKSDGKKAAFSIDEALFLGRLDGTVRVTNNAYMDEKGAWQIKDKSKKAFTLEIRDNGTLDLFGTRTDGETNWRHMASFDAVNNQVLFPSGEVKISALTFTSQKVCSPVVGNAWRDTIIVPASWTKDTCKKYAAKLGASHQLACIFEDNSSVGDGEGTPIPNCGW